MPARAQGLSIACWSPLVLAACVAFDLQGIAATDARALAALFALALALGALNGVLWELLFALLARAPRSFAAAFWLLACALLAAWSCDSLGVLARLGGVYDTLALGSLAGAVLGAPLLAAVLFALQPTAQHPRGLLAAAAAPWRIAGGCALACAALACYVADRRVFVGLYPSAHVALRLGCIWLGSFALAALLRVPAWRARTSWAELLLSAALAFALVGHDARALLALGERAWPRLVLDAARRGSDVDFDGYGGWLGGGDCAPFDRAVHPAAPEIPGNGIDDNCLLGDAKVVAPDHQQMALPAQPSPLDIVLITVDSLRADRVGSYCKRCGSGGLATTPNLDAFARDALVFDHAYTPGGWTSIAVSSLMRGVYPRRLDWTRAFETNHYRLVRAGELDSLRLDEHTVKMFPLPLRDEHPSIAHWLARRGMHTAAVVDDEYSELLSRDSAIAPGFAVYREVDDLPPERRDDQGTAELALRELASVPAGERGFLWVHFFGPHSPNHFHPGVRLDGATIEQGYEHEIRYTDLQIGRLLRAIEARDVPTAVFVSADHGEEFIASGRHHGWSVHDAVLHVPLLARVPGWPRGHTGTAVSLVDLMPTILALTATPIPAGLDGVSLAGLLQDLHGAAPVRTLFADTWRYDGDGHLLVLESAALAGSEKVVYQPLAGGFSESRAGDSQLQPIGEDAPLPALRALAGYVESSNGPFRLHD